MKEDENRDIESLLKSIRLKPAPAGLRDKVLRSARQSKTQNRVMTPLLWRCVSCCALVLTVVLGLDAFLVSRQTKHFQSYLGGRPLLKEAQDMSWPELAKDLDESADSKLLVQARRQMAGQWKIRGDTGGTSPAEISQEVF